MIVLIIASIIQNLIRLPWSEWWWYLIKGDRARPEKVDTYLGWHFESENALARWEEKVFSEPTKYTIVGGVRDQGNIFEAFYVAGEMFETDSMKRILKTKSLKAESKGGSSALYRELNVNMEKRPHLAWEWHAAVFPKKKRKEYLDLESENDFAAKVYAIFRGRTVLTSDVIQYVWDEHAPENTMKAHPASDRIKVLVVQRGPEQSADPWIIEERDLYRDYEILFGKKPTKRLGAVALMSDSDNTQSQSLAFFKRMEIKITN